MRSRDLAVRSLQDVGVRALQDAGLAGVDADDDERRRAVSAAKARVGQAARFVGQQAIQLHGGMGMTDELDVSHYFKRLTAIDLTFGDTDFHIQQFVALSG